MRMILIILPVMSQMTSDMFSISYLKTVVPDLYIALTPFTLYIYHCFTTVLIVANCNKHNTVY